MDIKDYKFNVGDKVITTEGETGKIVSICTCSDCEERGFFEPTWTTDDGDIYYITAGDAAHGFYGFYQIGKYRFHDFDKSAILREIAWHEEDLEKLQKQLRVIEENESAQHKDCDYCKNGTYRKSFHQWDGTFIRKANFCEECGRDLRHL